MKKILAIVAVIILTASIVKAQAGWITHKADNRISVKFPVEPSDKVPGSLIATSADSSCVFVFTMVDFLEVANVDSVALAPVKDTPEFAAQLKTGVLEKLQGVNLADFTIGKWKGFTSYTSGGTDSILRRYDMFMVIIGNKLYSFSTVTRSGSSLEGRDTFLNSIVLSY